jgi:serine protease Do
MGSPAGVSQSVTRGIVSNTQLMLPSLGGGELREEGEAVGSVVRWIGHDAVIFPGNSGGPLVNLQGEVVGINEIVLGSLGGAIPSNLARDVANQLIAHGEVARSWIGLQSQPRSKNLPVERGVLVGGVLPDSPAARAGLRPGDIVVEYDGVAVDARIQEDMPAFNRLLISVAVGKTVKVNVLRDGQPQVVTLVTEARGKAQGEPVEVREWGMVVRDLTRLAAIERQRTENSGVLVASVGLASPVANAKPALAPGDILLEAGGRPLRTVADLRAFTDETVKGATDRKPVLVRFDRGKVRYLTVIRIGREPDRPEVEPARKAGLSAELQALSPDLAEALGLKGRSGALVSLVYPGHAAERAGLRQGDILTKLDGEPVRCQRPEDVEDVYGQVRRYRVGREIECEVLRETETLKLTLKLEEDLLTAEDRQRYKDETFDLTFEKLTELDRIHRDLPPDLQGVKIAQIETGGWAQLAGLRVNDIVVKVDDQAVPDVAAAKRLLQQAATVKARQVMFFLRRGAQTLFTEIEPTWESARAPQPEEPGAAASQPRAQGAPRVKRK